MNPAVTATTDPLPERGRPGWVRFVGAAIAGAYALYAVLALRGESLSPTGWTVGLMLVALLALAEAWMRPRRLRDSFIWELGVCVVGILAARLVPGWAAGGAERAAFILVARALTWLLRGAVRIAAGSAGDEKAEHLRLLGLFVLSSATLLAYLSPNLVGPKDARWYGNIATDFVTQIRAGTFPVFSGETIYAFNGTVQTIRSAPWHLYFTALIDGLTLHGLTPLAAENVTVVISYVAAVLAFYIALVRWRPTARWTAWMLALVFATSPSIMLPLAAHDMRMTIMALPVLVLVYYALARAIETPSFTAYFWIGTGCAALWLCHPPMALLAMAVVVFCLTIQLAIYGPTTSAMRGAVAGSLTFVALAAPYFYSMSELPPERSYDLLPNIVLPALALFLLVVSLAQALRHRSIRWLILLPFAGWILAEFKPSLLPFAGIAIALTAVIALAGRVWPRLGVSNRVEPWLLVIFFVAAAGATSWSPGRSLPEIEEVSRFINPEQLSLFGNLASMVRGNDSQPHAVWWILMFVGLVLIWRTHSIFARLAFFATIIGVATFMPLPFVKLFIWGNSTIEFRHVLNLSDWPRRWIFCMPLLLFAVFPLLAELSPRPVRAKVLLSFLLPLLAWAVWDHVRFARHIVAHTTEETARLYRPENIVMQTYSWDLLRIPRYYSHGVMDPRLEVRLWRRGGDHPLLIDPDAIARDLEKQLGGEVLHVQATQDPTYPVWVYLAPKIELKPGEQKLLRFDFHGRTPTGWLILRGQDIYREYVLPASGLARAFGSGPLNTRTLSLWNSGPRTETIEIAFKREGPNATGEVRPGDFPEIIATPYDPSRALVEVKSLHPLRLRINAPEKGLLELFRSDYPGYRVSLNGQPVPHVSSPDNLIALEVPAGNNEIEVRFRGTWQLRAFFWYGLTAWTIVAAYTGVTLVIAGGGWRTKTSGPDG